MKLQLDLFREIIVDNFAGGGGASTGIELATGLNVDVAINHDPAAIAMHKANHPETEHYCESVWDIDPKEVTKGRKVGLCWLSPDCKHFSKAKGGKPVSQKIRGLAWIAIDWAISVRPRVIMLENVEEFKTWGPLKKNDKGDWVPDPERKGMTFRSFRKSLEALGYEVDTRELQACDYGAPTTRKRLFLIARCDGKPIEWPEPTHGDPSEINVQMGLKKPYRTAGEIIDWSLPAPSIFTRKQPLKENTLLRISRGLQKYVIESNNPYIVENKACFIQHYYTHQGKETRASSLDEPVATIPTANRFGLVTAFLAKHYGGNYKGSGISMKEPLHTITVKDHHALVSAFLIKYYGQGVGQSLDEPLHTISTKDRFGLVTIADQDYKIVDIGMRMLQPHELFKAQGFPNEYIIGRDYEGNRYPKSQQVARCGNSVPPPFAEALVRANLPEMCVKKYEYKAAITS
ncbi:DNA cytosine methyltransferase [Sediminibacillus halophilus]|uniref:DNA cytosine methyltransferase n=1 Tax=Sediminibacillus halophilus TaxID=482461 RepID=UPI0009420E0B|nr:DNA cytosine methyltransferase [Sediminibacillus halophilus]